MWTLGYNSVPDNGHRSTGCTRFWPLQTAKTIAHTHTQLLNRKRNRVTLVATPTRGIVFMRQYIQINVPRACTRPPVTSSGIRHARRRQNALVMQMRHKITIQKEATAHSAVLQGHMRPGRFVQRKIRVPGFGRVPSGCTRFWSLLLRYVLGKW